MSVLILASSKRVFWNEAMLVNCRKIVAGELTAEQAAENAARLLAAARASGDLVVHVRHESAEKDPSFFAPGSVGAEIHPSVASRDGEAVVVAVQDIVNGVARRDHGARGFFRAREFAHHLVRRSELADFGDAQVVGRFQHGLVSSILRPTGDKKAARRLAAGSGILMACLQIKRVPPSASGFRC